MPSRKDLRKIPASDEQKDDYQKESGRIGPA